MEDIKTFLLGVVVMTGAVMVALCVFGLVLFLGSCAVCFVAPAVEQCFQWCENAGEALFK